MKAIFSTAAALLLLASAAGLRAEGISTGGCDAGNGCDISYSSGLSDCCGGSGCDGCSDCCDISACCGSRAGIVGGVDLTLFKFYARQGAGGDSNAGNVDDYFPEYGYLGHGRYWIGYELDSGWGIRGRMFRWQGTESYLGIDREQEFEIYDIESTVDMCVMGWDLTGIGGIRWGSIELNGTDFGGIDPYRFEGVGMTVGVDFRRGVWGNLAVVGGVRYSVLYGETEFTPVSNSVLDNTFMDITEVRLGVEWSRETRLGGRVFASAVWEQQVYGTETYLPFAIDPETLGDVSLAGPVFSVGFDR
ncbi:MAG: hypothetical protein J5I93_20860 [Pirellulaceae bacterium]|nr:hypothetical protein [Pirellulaceae bacterium]